MASKLDRTRPFGSVHGGTSNVAYEQDGKEFDASGNEIVRAAAAPKATQAPGAPADAGAAAIVTKDAQGNLFLDGQIIDTEDATVETLRVIAKDMGLRLHPQTGKAKVLAAIIEAAGPVDQLATQMGG